MVSSHENTRQIRYEHVVKYKDHYIPHILACLCSTGRYCFNHSTNQHVYRNGMMISWPIKIRYPCIGGKIQA